jgi:hypothetical protein
MNTTILCGHFILNCSTRSGFKQSMKFRLAPPIDFHGLPEADKLRFTRYAIDSHGLSVEINPDALIEVLAFSSEAECRKEYEQVRGDRQGTAPRVSRHN